MTESLFLDIRALRIAGFGGIADRFESLAQEHGRSELRDQKLFDARDLVAVRIAWDELVSYIETTDEEGSLDDEEMPDGKLRWAADRLAAKLREAGDDV